MRRSNVINLYSNVKIYHKIMIVMCLHILILINIFLLKLTYVQYRCYPKFVLPFPIRCLLIKLIIKVNWQQGHVYYLINFVYRVIPIQTSLFNWRQSHNTVTNVLRSWGNTQIWQNLGTPWSVCNLLSTSMENTILWKAITLMMIDNRRAAYCYYSYSSRVYKNLSKVSEDFLYAL